VTAEPHPSLSRGQRAVELYCERRTPEELRGEIRVECRRRGNSLTIVELRPPWHPEHQDDPWTDLAVAQLRFDPSTERWSLHSSDSNGRWHRYEAVGGSTSVDPLLREIEADPTGIFWG